MKYILNPSLEHIALIKIVVTLWNHNDIRALLKNLHFPLVGSDRKQWQDIELKVIQKILQLPQPKLMQKKMLGLVHPIGIQILNWIKHHRHPFFGIELPSELCWTPQGTVDRKRTAEMLVKDGSLDITTCYNLTSVYCLEDCVSAIWNEIPISVKESFYCENFPTEKKISKLHKLAVIFTYDMKQDMKRMESMIEKILEGNDSSGYTPYQYAFGHAADCGNKMAAEYFLKKLAPEQREDSLFFAAKLVKDRLYTCYRSPHGYIPIEYYIEVLCFLLSEIEEKQQGKFIKIYTYEILKSFLDWPWQKFFMEIANQVWEHLHVIDYDCLLEVILYKEVNGIKDCNYQELFAKFWTQSLNTHKNYTVNRCVSSKVLSDLFEIGDEDNIRLILESATIQEKEEIIFSYQGKRICESLVYRSNHDALNFFLKECILSKDVMVKFKEEFKEHIKLRHSDKKLEKETEMWIKFFLLLDNLIQ